MRALAETRVPGDARPDEWRALYAEALAFWQAFYPHDEAVHLASGEVVNRWHKLYGLRVPTGICAGCRKRIGEGKALTLDKGNAVHFESFDCLIRYGTTWRVTAAQALTAMGLTLATEQT
jgi:hypothetical protein